MDDPVRITIWNEFRHEKKDKAVQKLYPEGIHVHLANELEKDSGIKCATAVLDDPEHGLTKKVLDMTDVLIWWGHIAHQEVDDVIVERVQKKVLSGMGLIVLHSAHNSKIFCRLMGTECSLQWREAGEKERLWTIEPGHPIAKGVGKYIELPQTEMYSERFDIPDPDKIIFISWFEGGEVFRSGCCWTRGHGRIFYFRPGHETYPIFHNEEIIKILKNSVRWADRKVNLPDKGSQNVKRIEKL